jgi:hypothetical protein
MSTSAALLSAITAADNEVYKTSGLTPENTAVEAVKVANLIRESDVIVVGFPLYVDGIPSHLLRLLDALGKELKSPGLADKESKAVYVIINSGFFEPVHMLVAADIFAFWCGENGLDYKGAILVGAGGIGPSLASGKGVGRRVGRALDMLSEAIPQKKSIGILKTTPVFPRQLYIWAGNKSWIKAAKKRGISKTELY